MDSDKLKKVQDGFLRQFGHLPTVVSRAPGRLEILGNHTDYNLGTVLSVAVDRAMYIASSPVEGRECQIVDLNVRSRRSFSLDALWPPLPRDWSNYLRGLIYEMQRRGVQVPAFQAVLMGEVPLSAGMSSSAALEMAMMLILNELSGANLAWQDCARIGQACENGYVGANTGLMDQFSSLRGRRGCLVYSDFRTLEVRNIPMPENAAFVVVNSMVKHNLTNEYNERRTACEEAVRLLAEDHPGVQSLRDVSPSMLEASRGRLPEIVYRRAKHVVGEIDRVERGVQALASADLVQFGALMTESQASSREYFENSCPEIDALTSLGTDLHGYFGSRLSGGGFGGITVHLTRGCCAEQYLSALQERYLQQTGLKADGMVCLADEGAEIVRLNN